MWLRWICAGVMAVSAGNLGVAKELPQVPATCLKTFARYPYVPIFATQWPEGTIVSDTAPSKNLFAVKADKWLEPDAEFERKMRLRRALYQDRPEEVFAVQPGYEGATRDAGTELLNLLAAHLSEHFPAHYRLHAGAIEIVPLKLSLSLREDGVPPLVKCGLLVQDDITLSFPSPSGGHILGAGFLAVPSDWSLTEKLGKSPSQIHEAVPGYAEKVAKMVDGLFRQLPAGKFHGRNNWKLYTDPTESISLWRASPYHEAEVTAQNVASTVYFRTEWQTLMRLPVSGAIVFTIRPRTFQLPHLKKIAPEKAAQIAAALRKGQVYNALHDDWAGFVADYLSP